MLMKMVLSKCQIFYLDGVFRIVILISWKLPFVTREVVLVTREFVLVTREVVLVTRKVVLVAKTACIITVAISRGPAGLHVATGEKTQTGGTHWLQESGCWRCQGQVNVRVTSLSTCQVQMVLTLWLHNWLILFCYSPYRQTFEVILKKFQMDCLESIEDFLSFLQSKGPEGFFTLSAVH